MQHHQALDASDVQAGRGQASNSFTGAGYGRPGDRSTFVDIVIRASGPPPERVWVAPEAPVVVGAPAEAPGLDSRCVTRVLDCEVSAVRVERCTAWTAFAAGSSEEGLQGCGAAEASGEQSQQQCHVGVHGSGSSRVSVSGRTVG